MWSKHQISQWPCHKLMSVAVPFRLIPTCQWLKFFHLETLKIQQLFAEVCSSSFNNAPPILLLKLFYQRKFNYQYIPKEDRIQREPSSAHFPTSIMINSREAVFNQYSHPFFWPVLFCSRSQTLYNSSVNIPMCL